MSACFLLLLAPGAHADEHDIPLAVVFPAAVVREVLAQDPAQLFHSSQGVMFGRGAVWADEFCGRKQPPGCPVLVTTVNLLAK